jgi:hypothetical protein
MSMQQRNRTKRLRGDFGSEYDRTVDRAGSRRDAERELESRQERVSRLRLRPLTADERVRYTENWHETQERFVDDPNAAIGDAQRLVERAMEARGFPVGDWDQQVADVSVEHPQVVEDYHAAREIAEANDRGDADTEQLRQAMVHYRSLFRELVNTGADTPPIESDGDGRVTEPGSRRGQPPRMRRRDVPGTR